MIAIGFDTDLQELKDSKLSSKSIQAIIIVTMNWLLTIVTVLAVIGFIISGVYFITAQGSGEIEEAKSWMIYSIIGIVVALIGYIIINLVNSLLLGNATQTIVIP